MRDINLCEIVNLFNKYRKRFKEGADVLMGIKCEQCPDSNLRTLSELAGSDKVTWEFCNVHRNEINLLAKDLVSKWSRVNL